LFLQKEDGEIYMSVASYIVHEKYGERSKYDNDISLLSLSSKAPISSTVGIACLPPRALAQNTFEGEKMLTSGWGKIRENGPSSKTLMAAFVNGVSNNECSELYSNVLTEVK
jgi:hypothetical protein